MSVHYVVQWSVRLEDVDACEAALQVIADHVRDDHPDITSVQVYRQTWGPLPIYAYVWLDEYADLATLEADKETPRCDEVWRPLDEMAQAGTFVASLWDDRDRSAWFAR